VPVTVYGVATALMRSPEQVAAMTSADWEIASHGLKWIEYKDFTEADERQHLREAIRIHTETTGSRPLGWYTGRCSVTTRRLVMEEGGFLYDSDDYSDDLPYWTTGPKGPHLVIPYTLDANDMRFATPQGFNSGDQFYSYLKDSFEHSMPRRRRAGMMSVAALPLGGRRRAASLQRFTTMCRPTASGRRAASTSRALA
jgi:peptidoglycan/xylan/chitin deacetylase (PgdA/CDA1 family)